MCVWSAYAGRKQAAPVVYEGLRKIEGYWAGFYTGIVSCDNGTFYFDKCCGSTDVFAGKFDLADFPGTMALAHSRTASGGLANRAHPFVGTAGVVALVSQGAPGVFQPLRHQYTDVLMELYNEGRRPRSGSKPECGMRELPGLTTPDGLQISAADVETNSIEREYMKHGDIVKALRDGCARLPGEHCSICLFADKPGTIGFINMNQRVCYAFEEDGVYMATSMDALPTGTGMEIPGNSVGYVTSDGLFHREALGDIKINSFIPGGLEEAALAFLKENPKSLLAHICDKALRPLFKTGELDYHSLAAYRTIENLRRAGLVQFEESERPNTFTGKSGRGFLWSLKEK